MKNLKRKFQEDPMFAVLIIAVGATVLTGLIKETAHLVGSSGYALHAHKRESAK